ncbi:MAG TPA: DegV family protein, partial [Ktedonobacterales bacterium]|nr:DegV family protein [Ktedonobacterales bacterium]
MNRFTGGSVSSAPPFRWDRGHPRVSIVTDSTATMLSSHAQALGILVVPNRIVLGERVYRDGLDLTAAQFYAHFSHIGHAVSTEPASAEDFALTYQWAFAHGAAAIVSIHPSRRVSQVFAHAVAARDALAPAPIDVVDSALLGVGMWPAVVRAAQLANTGASAQVIHERVVAVLARTRLYSVLESLDYIRRGGRSARAVRLFGRVRDAYPILTYEGGEAVPVDTVRTRRRALQRMRELALGQGPLEELLVAGTSIEWIGQMEAALAEHYRGAIQKTWQSPTIGVHTGPSVSIGVVYTDESRR